MSNKMTFKIFILDVILSTLLIAFWVCLIFAVITGIEIVVLMSHGNIQF